MITKSDLCWVLVRAAGIYLIYTALATTFGLIVGMMTVRDATKKIRDAELRSSPTTTSMGLFLGSAVLPFSFGVYLLRSGRTIHACLMAAPDLAIAYIPGANRLGLGLEAAELEVFQSWLQLHPELASRSPEDKVALFRDSQKATR